MRSSCFLLAGLALAACSSSEELGPFLGPVGPSSASLPSPVGPSGRCEAPVVAVIDAPSLAVKACSTTLDGAGSKPGLVSDEQGYGVALASGVRRLARGSDGCPGQPGALLPVEGALGPIAEGDQLWVAREGGVKIFEGEVPLASCELAGVRSLAAAGSTAWAATARGVIPVQFTGEACLASEPWPLGGAPLAVGRAEGDRLWVVSVDAGCGVPVLRRHLESSDIDTTALGGGKALGSLGLCSISALAEREGRLVAVDSACRRVVVVDTETGAPLGQWSPTEVPVGVAFFEGGVTLATLASGKLRFHIAPF